MPITVFASPQKLAWTHFTVVPNRIRDPADGEMVDALTRFEFLLPSKPAEKDGGMFRPATSNTLVITPNCKVWSGVRQTKQLLTHEQFHYDVGIVVARALARQLMATRARTEAELKTKIAEAAKLHFFTRNRLIQRRYDKDSKHGKYATGEKIWRNRMRTCLANVRSKTIGGYWL